MRYLVKSIALTTVLLVAACGSAEAQNTEQLLEQQVAGLERVVAAFETIHDETTAKAAADTFLAFTEEAMSAAQTMPLAEKLLFDKRYRVVAAPFQKRILAGMTKIYTYPGAMKYMAEKATAQNKRTYERYKQTAN